MTDKITVELDEEQIRGLLRAHERPTLHVTSATLAALKAALPPEWEEGTLAWVTDFTSQRKRFACERVDQRWRIASTSEESVAEWLNDSEVIKVEPIRVLKDDEVAVKNPSVNSTAIRFVANLARKEYHWGTADWLEGVANALEAEK